MPPQAAPAPTAVPQGQVNPMMMALLRARAQQGAQGMPTGSMPNGIPTPGAPGAPPAPPAAAVGTPGGATPTQQVTKAAQQAQSPLMDQGTRNIAKALVQKLLQHM
jgi:hypothetical protein